MWSSGGVNTYARHCKSLTVRYLLFCYCVLSCVWNCAVSVFAIQIKVFKPSFSSLSARWKNTSGKSLSAMVTPLTTRYTRTWWRIFLPKRMRTKTASYPPESLLTNTMNFSLVFFCAAIWCKHSLVLPDPLLASTMWSHATCITGEKKHSWVLLCRTDFSIIMIADYKNV